MVIFMDIKPLIVAGFVLVLLNSSGGHPLYNRREPRSSVFQGRMTMLRKSCIDSLGNMGICMFKWDCISQQGITLSTCVDGFLFGACCSVKDDSQGNWIFNSEYESTTNNDYTFTTKSNTGENNTISVIESETLSSLVQNLNVSTLRENGFTDDFSSLNATPASLSEIFKYDVNITLTETNDISTSTKRAFDDESTESDISSNANLLDSKFDLDVINSTNDVYFIKELTDFEVSGSKKTENDTYIELKSNNNLEGSVLEEKIQNSKVNRTKNDIAGESAGFSIYVEPNANNHMNVKNESLKPEEHVPSNSAFFENYDSTENYVLSEITHNIETNSTNSEPFQTDTKTTEFETAIRDKIVFGMEGDFITENVEVKTNISSIDNTKDAENFITEGIALPFWGDNLSILPPSFQYLISQLTSKETSNSHTTINPMVQSNGTFFSDEKDKTTISESVIINNAEYISDLEIFNVDNNAFVDKSNLVLVTNEVNSHTNHNTDSTFADIFSSTISVSPDTYEFLETTSKDLYTGITENSLNASNENFSAPISDKNYTSSEETHTIESEEKLTTDVLSGVSNNVLNENLQSFFLKDKEDNYIQEENYSTTYSTFETTKQNLYSSSKNDVLNSTSTNNYQVNFFPNQNEFNPTYDKSSEKVAIPETTFTEITDEFSTRNKFNQDVTTIQGLIDFSSDDGDNNKNVNKNENGDIKTEPVHSHSTTSVQSINHSQEFIFDITTDILKFFTKTEINNIDSSNHEQLNSFSSFLASEQKLPIESIEKDLVIPSQTHNQEIYDATFESTVSETLESFPNKHFSSINTEMLSQNSQNIPISQTSPYIKESTIQDFGEYVSTDNKSTVESWTDTNFSTIKSVMNEEAVSENPELNDSSSDFSEYSINNVFLFVTNGSENFGSDFGSETKLSYTFLNDYTPDITKINDIETEEISQYQSLSNSTSEISSVSFVNESILITTSNSLTSTMYSYSIDSTTSPDDDEFNYTKTVTSINKIYNETTFSSFNITSDLTSNSSKYSESTSIVTSTVTKTPQKPVKEYTWNYKKDCGVRPMQPVGRIVGGRNTQFGKWPWQALVKEATWLGLFVKNKCGGVLITSKYVLTAAHCQPGFLASLLVVLGTHDISNLKDNGLPIIRNVKRMVVHRHYNALTFENDLALLEMDTELEFMPHVVPICLPHRYEDFTGEMAFVTGWGKLTHGGDVPNILQEVQVPIVANDECQKMFYQAGHQKVIQNNFVCAGYTNGGQDSCEGDSGGPLMVQRKDKRWVLAGTVSHGIGCADPNLPGVYMRMSSYRPWIDSIINK